MFLFLYSRNIPLPVFTRKWRRSNLWSGFPSPPLGSGRYRHLGNILPRFLYFLFRLLLDGRAGLTPGDGQILSRIYVVRVQMPLHVGPDAEHLVAHRTEMGLLPRVYTTVILKCQSKY
jgi:hypothetical protein